MTDSVTEGKYALCRKALTSLDIWARETLENNSSVAQNKRTMSEIRLNVRMRSIRQILEILRQNKTNESKSEMINLAFSLNDNE